MTQETTPTEAQISRAAWALPGLRAYVEREVARG